MTEATDVLVIAGPTATGKTAAALTIARKLDGELVGADSVQVYRGFDIGSAKPTADELGGIAHHLVDILDPNEAIDAAGYARFADQAIADISSRGRLPIIVGGTGLWIRALMRGLVEVPAVDPRLRESLETRAASIGSTALHAELQQVDPLTAQVVHPHDQLRIIRALEVHAQTGTPLGELRKRHALGAPRYRGLFVVIDAPRANHLRVIERRVDSMVKAAWIEEVRSLRDRWGDEPKPFSSVGYREMLAHVRDEVPWETTRRAIVKATRVYARRQRTWFRGEPGIDWYTDANELVAEQGLERIRRVLDR